MWQALALEGEGTAGATPVILNAANALQNYENEKKIRIASRVENDRVYVCVEDSGPGVPEDLREKIFDPFYTTYADGSGIGLSIAQRIIADHNGKIRVGSSRWGGAEFVCFKAMVVGFVSIADTSGSAVRFAGATTLETASSRIAMFSRRFVGTNR